MKVYIGPFKHWYGPYQLAESLCFWVKDIPNEIGILTKPEWVHNFGEFLAHGFTRDESDKSKNKHINKERPITWLYKFLLWIDSKRERKVYVKIDEYDTWNMYNTLALIILPMLKQFKMKKQGYPMIEIDEIPKSALPLDDHEGRWNWVLNEMIWAFKQLQPDYDWESQYYSGEADFYFTPYKTDENGKVTMYQMETGPNDTFKMNEEGIRIHQERIDKGLKMFGKYFQHLWQ